MGAAGLEPESFRPGTGETMSLKSAQGQGQEGRTCSETRRERNCVGHPW